MGVAQRNRRHPGYEHGCFVTHLIHDLQLPLRGFADILLADVSDPKQFRLTVENLSHYAEHCVEDDIPFRAAVRQVAATVEKLPTWGASNDEARRRKARAKFDWAEARCKRVNKKLRFYARHPQRMPKLVRLVLNRAIDLAHQTLGSCDIDWGDCGFGPGVTYASGRSFHQKLGDQTCTSGAWSLAKEALREWPHWLSHLTASGSKLQLVRGDRISFVPKNAGTFRTIGIQSSLQVFIQKAMERSMERKLRAVGVDLSNQNRNRDLLGRWEEIATIDQTSASDCGALEMYRMFLPSDWFAAVFAASSRFYTFKVDEEDRTQWHRYEKLSAMGNCTTFPLETLVFWTVARATSEVTGGNLDLVRAYGDDVIVPKNAALLTIEVLTWLGFMPNREKTFVTGPFRETCGKDTLWGVDIRPVYVRVEPRNDTEVYGLFNRLLTNRMGHPMSRALKYLHSLVRQPFYGPAFYGASNRDLIFLGPDLVSDWFSGKSAVVDGFFWSPQPFMDPVIITHGLTPVKWWWLEFLGKRQKRKSSGCEQTDYLAFLAGRRGGLEDQGAVVAVCSGPVVGHWHVGNLPYPDLYPTPRPTSTRVLRRIVGEVIGAR